MLYSGSHRKPEARLKLCSPSWCGHLARACILLLASPWLGPTNRLSPCSAARDLGPRVNSTSIARAFLEPRREPVMTLTGASASQELRLMGEADM